MAKFIGIALLAGGAVLMVHGFQARDSIEARVSSVFSNSSRNKVTALLACGAASAVAGAAIILMSGKSR